MTKRPRDSTVGPWAKEKLDALGQYLNFYTTVLKKQSHWLRGTIFVDAFAGPGLSRVRTTERAAESPSLFGPDAESDTAAIQFLKGSPRVALDITNPFTSYMFVERDPQRIGDLNALKSEYAGKRVISVKEGDANAALKDWLAGGIDWRTHRAVVFLDPFGMQVPWATIEALAATKAIEVLINFPLWTAINRLLTRSGEIDSGWQASPSMRSSGQPTGERSSTWNETICSECGATRSTMPVSGSCNGIAAAWARHSGTCPRRASSRTREAIRFIT
jgi:three-Cys-motif partner protein